MYELNQHVISLFFNCRIQCLLNLAFIYTSDAFFYRNAYSGFSALKQDIFLETAQNPNFRVQILRIETG